MNPSAKVIISVMPVVKFIKFLLDDRDGWIFWTSTLKTSAPNGNFLTKVVRVDAIPTGKCIIKENGSQKYICNKAHGNSQ